MTDQEFELLSAYFDGELSPEKMAEIEAALETDSELRAAFEALSRTQASLAPAFNQTMHETPPERLTDMLTVSEGTRGKERMSGWLRSLISPPALAGATAALALGVVAGTALAPQKQNANSLVIAAGDHLVAGSELDQLLSASASGDIVSTEVGKGLIRLSIALEDGSHCRHFYIGASTGIACTQEGGPWGIETLVAHAPVGNEPELELASSEMPDAVRATLESLGSVEPLNAEAESELIERKWR